MKYLKYGLYALIVLIIVVGAVFAYVAATFDPNEYKSDIVELVRDKTSRNLNIEGDIHLTFFPKIGVSLGPTQLSEAKSEAEFAAVDDLRVALALLPLLSKQIVVDEVVIDGLRARLIKNADGTTNIDDLTKRAEEEEESSEGEAEPSEGEEADGPAMALDVQGVRIQNGAFSYRDEQAGATYEVSEFDLETGRVADGVPTPFEYSAVVQADKPQLDLRTRASGTLEADIASQIFKLTGLEVGAEGVAATVSDLELVISAADVEAQPAIQSTVANTLSVEVSGSQEDMTFNAKLDAPRLAMTQDEAVSEAIMAVVQARGPEMQADANVQLSAIKASPSVLNIGELAIDLDALQGENAVKGQLSTPVAGDLENQRFRLTKIAGEYDVRSPALPMQSTTIPLSGSIDADVKRERVKVDLKARFDKSNIEGVFNVRQFAEPFIGFDATIDKLDVDRYRLAEQAQQEQTPNGESGGEKGESRIDLSPLKALNLDGKLRIGALTAANVKLSDVRMTVKAKDGKVEINPLLAKLYGGSIRSVVTADANTNAFAVKQSLSGVTIGPLLQDALDQDLLDGRGSVDLDLTAQGDTVGALTKTLTGDAGMALKDGAVKGINLAQSLRSAKDMLTLKQNKETAASPTEKTDFSDLKATFRIDKGQARNEDLALSSPFVRLTGAGSMNLVEGSMDYVANTSLVATSKGQDGDDLSDLSGFTVPVRVSGPLTALNYELQFSDAIEQQAKQRLKAEETKLKKKLESGLTEKLLGGGQGDTDAAKEDAAPSAKPEDEVKKRLKDLFR